MNTGPTTDFLHLVSQSIFANPFTRQRHLADCRLTGLAPETPAEQVLAAAIHTIERQADELLARTDQPLRTCRDPRRRQLGSLFLFTLFHRYLDRLDAHIDSQDTSVDNQPLACGRELERELDRCGFTAAEIELYIALFFQMRRAYLFIGRSLVGTSACMEQVRAHLWTTLFTHDIEQYAEILRTRLEDFSTLLLGETGTGKGLAASAIGRSGFIPYSRRGHRFAISFRRAFLELNLAQFPEQLLESELFGHARGAFTGAVRDHEGVLARTSPHGALLLDEIGETSPATQIKLLRVLQERTFTPVGSHEEKRFTGRLIGATNRDIPALIRQGRFREDFYFRLCTDQLVLPPLRQRLRESAEELPALVTHLTRRITGARDEQLAARIMAALEQDLEPGYPWPGNVRELEQAIRRIILHGQGRWRAASFGGAEAAEHDLFDRGLSVAAMTRAYCRHLYRHHSTLQAVARITGLDRRTVKKYLEKEESSTGRKDDRL